MGAEPQTYENAIKPYGLIYELVINDKIPVYWSINPDKAKDGIDFTYNGKDYKAGSFIIPAKYAVTAATTLNTWEAKGVVVDGPTSSAFDASVFDTITSFPNTLLDLKNGKILQEAFYIPAEIPVSAYRTGTPDEVQACDDIFAMPHAEPDQDWGATTIKAFTDFVHQGGYLWSGCRSASAIENKDDGGLDIPFLTINGLIGSKQHENNDGLFSYNPDAAGNPIMQFLGTIDGAVQGGAEDVYLPEAAGWRPTTMVLVSDNDHVNVKDGNSPGPAAIVAFGNAEGNVDYGKVLYEASHNIGKDGTETQRVAAARIYGNFLLLSGVEQRIEVTEATFPDTIVANDSNAFSVTAPGATSFKWSSSCGGSFSPNNTSASVSFLAPATGTESCIVRVEIADACGRKRILTADVASPPATTKLTLVAKITNDNDGNKALAELGITTTAGGLSFDAGVVSADTTTYTADTLIITAGNTYQLSSTDLSGYTEQDWQCTSSGSGTTTVNNIFAEGLVSQGITYPTGTWIRTPQHYLTDITSNKGGQFYFKAK